MTTARLCRKTTVAGLSEAVIFCRPEQAQRSSGIKLSEISACAGTALRLFRPTYEMNIGVTWAKSRSDVTLMAYSNPKRERETGTGSVLITAENLTKTRRYGAGPPFSRTTTNSVGPS